MDQPPEIPKLPSNSEEPKKITTAKRIKKERNAFWENVKSVTSYIFLDVLVPAAKSTISDMMSNGVDMLLYGEPRAKRRDDRDRGRTVVSYDRYSDRDRDRPRERTRRSRFNLDEIVIPSRQDADEVLQSMFELLDEYNAVTVSEFMELVGLPDEYTDQNYGWINLRDAEVHRVRDGYILDLPEPRNLPR